MSTVEAGPEGSLYEPLLPPLYEISGTSQGPYALIAALIMVIVSGFTVLVKLQMTLTTFRKLRLDDMILVAALIFTLGYTIALCRSVRSGLGSVADGLTDSQVRSLGEYYLASNILLYPALAASKCSIALLVVAIQPQRWITMCLYGVAVTSVAWAVAAACVTGLQCGPNRWVLGPTSTDTCVDQYAAQIGLKVVDILTDVALVALPALMMSNVQVSVPKRIAVSFIFGLRIITPVFTACALASQSAFYDAPTPARSYRAVTPSIWTSVAVNTSVITACLPSIKRFFLDWAAGVANGMVGEAYEFQTTSNSKTRPAQASGIRSFMRSQPRSQMMSSRSRTGEDAAYTTCTPGSRTDRDGLGDDGDSKRGLTDGIIHTVDYTVQYDSAQFEEDRHRRVGSTSEDGRMRY